MDVGNRGVLVEPLWGATCGRSRGVDSGKRDVRSQGPASVTPRVLGAELTPRVDPL